MRGQFPAAGVMLLAMVASAGAETLPDYRDDRSTPQTLIESLYNAIERGEYLRAWSYFDESAVDDAQSYAEGYADTARVRLKIGEVTTEGAAGSIYASVPVAIEATSEAGEASVFTGCYETRQVQPAAQIDPPFRAIRIIAAALEPSENGFDEAEGACPEKGL